MQVLHTTPGGDRVLVSNDVLQLDRRIKDGDPTAGWAGDPRMFLVFNPLTTKYEVWRDCEDTKERIICSWPANQMDSRLLQHLAANDTWARNSNPLAELNRHNELLDAQHAAEMAAIQDEVVALMDFARRHAHVPGFHDIKGKYTFSAKKGK